MRNNGNKRLNAPVSAMGKCIFIRGKFALFACFADETVLPQDSRFGVGSTVSPGNKSNPLRWFSSGPPTQIQRGCLKTATPLYLVEAGGILRPSLAFALRAVGKQRRRSNLLPANLVKPPTAVLILPTCTNTKGLPENGNPFVFGGGGGNRTPVREYSAFGSTCLDRLLV